MLTSLSHPIDDGIVANACAAFNGSKAHAIDVEGQTMVFDMLVVALRAVVFGELAATLFADVSLLTVFMAVFGAVG